MKWYSEANLILGLILTVIVLNDYYYGINSITPFYSAGASANILFWVMDKFCCDYEVKE